MSIENSAGPNYFELSTYDREGKLVKMSGILEELPTFGLSTNWEASAMGTLGDQLKDFFMSDLFAGVSELFNSNNVNQISIDEWTSRMYSGTEMPTISLKFKIFKENGLGQTPAKVWIANLIKHATISSGNKLSAATMLDNIADALSKGAYDNGGEAFMTMIYGNGKKDDDLVNATEMAIISDILVEKMPSIVATTRTEMILELNNASKSNALLSEINNKKINALNTANIIFSGINTSTAKGNGGDGAIMNEVNGQMYNVVDKSSTFSKSAEDYNDSDEYDMVFYWAKKDGGSSSEGIDGFMDMDKRCIDVDKAIDAVKDEDSDWGKGNNDNKVLYADFIESFFRRVLNKANQVISEHSFDEDKKAYKELMKNSGVIQTVQSMMERKYGSVDRTKNNTMGSNLWRLKLYSFIFKEPLNVCITNWTVTPSKEMFGYQHAYFDFVIECKFDQVPAMKRWKYYLGHSDSDNGV